MLNQKLKIKKIIEIFNKSDPLDNDKIIQDKIPIFIIGMPRSGTSLLENILSSHGNVEGLGELNVLNNIANKEFLDNQIFNNLDLKKIQKIQQKNIVKLLKPLKQIKFITQIKHY